MAHLIGSHGPFLLHPEFAFSDFEHWGGAHNRGFEQCIAACRGAKCVLDVGAHIGLVTLPASRAVGPQGEIFAFEPAAANLAFLQSHLAFNGISNVTVVKALVGERDVASVRFFEQQGAAGQNSVVIKRNPERYSETQRPQVTVDSFCRERGLTPDVIKIDVEGSEIGVLEGARETLARCKPVVFLSVHPVELALLGHGPDELARRLDEIGYLCKDIDGRTPVQFRLDEYILTPKSS